MKKLIVILLFSSFSLYGCAQFKLTDQPEGWVLEYKTNAYTQAKTIEDSLKVIIIDQGLRIGYLIDSIQVLNDTLIAKQEIIDTYVSMLKQNVDVNKGTRNQISKLLRSTALKLDSLAVQNDSLIISTYNLNFIASPDSIFVVKP